MFTDENNQQVAACKEALRQFRVALNSESKIGIRTALLNLRATHRSLSFAVRDAKNRVMVKRAALDTEELGRQALLYQHSHLVACINDMRQHPALYLKVLEGINSPRISNFDASDEAFILTHLDMEMSERKRLIDEIKAAQARVALARSRLMAKQKEFEREKASIDSIIRASDQFISNKIQFFKSIDASAKEVIDPNESNISVNLASTSENDSGEWDKTTDQTISNHDLVKDLSGTKISSH